MPIVLYMHISIDLREFAIALKKQFPDWILTIKSIRPQQKRKFFFIADYVSLAKDTVAVTSMERNKKATKMLSFLVFT